MDQTTKTPGRSSEAGGDRKPWRRPTLERLSASGAMASSKLGSLADGSDPITNKMS